jgi:glutathione peroxidase
MKVIMLWMTGFLVSLVAVGAAESLYDISLKDINGRSTSLKPYQGKVMFIVNVASHCGYTPQYAGLEALHKKYQAQGLEVLGFPCNQFGAQEPGTNEEIKQFCSSKYNVSFPLFDKIEVNGARRHPLYSLLAGKDSPAPGDIRWNFTKFLVSRDGKIIKRFEPGTSPDSAEVMEAIQGALALK